MTESKKRTNFLKHKPIAVVHLENGENNEIVIHSTLTAENVTTLVAEKNGISFRDSRFFSLSFIDEFKNFHWLDPSALLIELVAASSNPDIRLDFSFTVKYYVDSIYEVQCASTASFYFYDVHRQLVRHELLVGGEDYFELIAILLAVYIPDCKFENIGEAIEKVMPESHPPYILMTNQQSDAEKRIFDKFRYYRRLPVGTGMISFLKLAEKSESYGYRMYNVVNDNNEKCLLSLGIKGIYIYRRSRHQNLVTPHMTFPWRIIDNLYYRDHVFAIEVKESKRRSSSENLADESILKADRQLSEAFSHPTTQVSRGRRRSGNNHRLIQYEYAFDTKLLCRNVWGAAIDQHRFHMERKAAKEKGHQRNTVDHQELTEKLNRLTSTSSLGSSLPSLSSLHSTSSSGTMPSAKIGDGSTSSLPPPTSATPMKPAKTPSTSSFHTISPEQLKRDEARYEELMARKQEMNDLLIEKLAQLRECCIAEGDITGTMPEEIHLAIQPGDEFPRLKRRVGTAYSIPDELIKADKADKMSQMETDVELHRRIVAAASRLATDKNTNKSVRKKRQKDLVAARQKLCRLEQGLQQMRHSASKPDISSIASDGSSNSWTASNNSGPITIAMTKSCPTTPRGSVPDLRNGLSHHMDDKDSFDENMEERVSRRAPSAISRHSLSQRYSGVSSSSTSSGSDSLGLGLPPRPVSRKSQQQQTGFDMELDNPLCDGLHNPLYENVGYRSTSYRSSYRQAHYPTIQDEHTQRKRAQSAHSISTDNGANGRTSTYSVPLNETAQKFITLDYDDEDDITPTIDHPQMMNVRRLTSSVSCQAGFATASLDRRQAKPNGVNRVPINGNASDDMVRQNVTTRITTFPVASPSSTVIISGKPYSASDLPRFQPPPPVARVTHMPRGSLPPYSTNGSPSINSVSSGKVPMNTNPQMEALLSYYKHQQQQQQSRNQTTPKTATIV